MSDSLLEFMDEKPQPSSLATIQRLAKKAVMLERMANGLEAELKAARAELLTLRRETIPDAMAEHGMKEFKLEDGSGVEVKQFVSGVLPKTPVERAEALQLLEEHGGVDLIKNELVVTFERKDHNHAVALFNDLQTQGYNATLDSTVHHSTLWAWCREKVRAGEQMDFEKLGVYVGRDTDIVLPEKL